MAKFKVGDKVNVQKSNRVLKVKSISGKNYVCEDILGTEIVKEDDLEKAYSIGEIVKDRYGHKYKLVQMIAPDAWDARQIDDNNKLVVITTGSIVNSIFTNPVLANAVSRNEEVVCKKFPMGYACVDKNGKRVTMFYSNENDAKFEADGKRYKVALSNAEKVDGSAQKTIDRYFSMAKKGEKTYLQQKSEDAVKKIMRDLGITKTASRNAVVNAAVTYGEVSKMLKTAEGCIADGDMGEAKAILRDTKSAASVAGLSTEWRKLASRIGVNAGCGCK